MTESETQSLLSFGASRARSYGTVERRYLGSSLGPAKFVNYQVKSNDTLTSIAVQFSVSVHQLRRTNKMYLTCDSIEPGRLLKIPLNENSSVTLESSPLPEADEKVETPKVEKVDDFFAKIDCGIRSSRHRLQNVSTRVVESLENGDNEPQLNGCHVKL